jgi:regulatory protein
MVEQVVHVRRSKFGSRRIVHELQQKGIDEDLIAAALPHLKETELETARTVWRKKFGAMPINAKERAKQIRFLMSRGFTSEIIRQVLRSQDE